MPEKSQPKDISPATIDLNINDPAYEFFYFTLLIFTIYGQSNPDFVAEKFNDLFPAEEYIASLQELREKFTEPKSKKVTLTIMNCATLLSNTHKLRQVLSDQIKVGLKRLLSPPSLMWEITGT